MILAFLPGFLTAEGETKPNLLGRAKETSYTDKVVVVKVGENDLVNKQAFNFFRRTLERVDKEKARAVVFELDTPGGIAFETTGLMQKMAKLTVPTFAYVNVEASSAGAFIAVATDKIYMAPQSTIGSAAVVNSTGEKMEETMRAKVESHLTSVIRNVVEKKGHNYQVVEAMMLVKKEAEFGDIITIEDGELLNLTATEAVSDFEGEPLLAEGIVDSIALLLKAEGIEGAEIVVAEMTGFERVAYWIGAFSGILILLGLGAIYLEIKTPGIGLGAVLAIAVFAVFFFGNYVAGNLSGYETAAIFVVGVVFVLLDIFLFPGTFFLGLAGVAMICGSLFFSMVDWYFWKDWKSDEVFVDFWSVFSGPMKALSIGILGSIALFAIMMRFLPNLPFLNRYFLPAAVGGGSGVIEEQPGHESRVGWTGTAETDLRPSGKAIFDGQVVDVTAESSFVKTGTRLRIVSEDGMRVVVKEIEV